MKKEILLIIIVLFNSVFCMAQDASGKIAQKDIDRLNKLALDDKSKSLFSKPLCDTPFIINIFHVYDPLKPNRADIRTGIEDGTFLRRIEPSWEYCAMGESLTQQRRVRDEGFRIVNLCQKGRSDAGPIGPHFDGTFKGSTG